jgi:hypothetical protein
MELAGVRTEPCPIIQAPEEVMAKKEWVVDPQRFVETTKVGLTALSAEDVALIETLVGEHLKSSPAPASRDLIPHIAEHFKYVYPALIADPRAADCLRQLNAAFGVADAPPETGPGVMPLAAVSGDETDEGSTDESTGPPMAFPWGATALGAGAAAIAGYYALQALADYCGDVHPPPGESAEVHC